IAARRAAGTTALGLPVMGLLFVMFPRIAPLWGVPTEAIGRTGLSNQLEFGAMNEIANDDGIAMRLRFDGPPPPPDQRY
ncbi:transglutaminaseTgpA domain-containing protein, partial [Acinetobacter baumannii]